MTKNTEVGNTEFGGFYNPQIWKNWSRSGERGGKGGKKEKRSDIYTQSNLKLTFVVHLAQPSFSKGALWTNSINITRNLLKMQILSPHLRPAESETLEWHPAVCFEQAITVVLTHTKICGPLGWTDLLSTDRSDRGTEVTLPADSKSNHWLCNEQGAWRA